MRRAICSAQGLRRALVTRGWRQASHLATPTAADATLVADHVASLQSSAERWEAKQRLAAHIAHLRNSERLATDAKLVAKHLSYLERGPQRRDAVLVAEHVAYLQHSAERAAAPKQEASAADSTTKAAEERQAWLLSQVASRIGRLEAALDAERLEAAASCERLTGLQQELEFTIQAAALHAAAPKTAPFGTAALGSRVPGLRTNGTALVRDGFGPGARHLRVA